MRFVRDVAVTLATGFLVALVAVLVDPKNLVRALVLGIAVCIVAAVLAALERRLAEGTRNDIAAIDLNPVAFDDATGELYALDAKVFLRDV